MADLLQVPEVIKAIDLLMDEVDDVLSAPDAESRREELADLIVEALRTGLVVGQAFARTTSNPIDDIAVSALQLMNLSFVIRKALGQRESS
jgi:hypothetical protein